MSSPLVLWVAGAVTGAMALALSVWAIWGDRSRGRRRCPRCWYDMSATEGLRCPECGREARSEQKLFKSRRRWRWAFVAGLLLLLAGGLGVTGKAAADGWASVTPSTVLIAIAQFSDDRWALDSLWQRVSEPYPDFANLRVVKPDRLWPWQWRWAAHTCLERVQSTNPPPMRHAAVYFLVNLPDELWSDELVEKANSCWVALLEDSVPSIRHTAILHCGRVLPPSQAIDVASRFLRDPDSQARSLAIGALMLIDRRGTNVEPILLDLAGSDDVELRRAAVHSLGRVKAACRDPIAIHDALLNRYRLDKDVTVRGYCLYSLVLRGANLQFLSSLLTEAIADSDGKLRAFAIEAEMFSDNLELLDPTHILKCLEDVDQDVRKSGFVAWDLLQRSSKQIEPELAHRIESRLNALRDPAPADADDS